MINFRIIARVFGLLLIFEGFFMLISAGISFMYHENAASSFIYSALIAIVTGFIIFTPLRNEERVYGNKEGYIIVSGIWLIFSVFGSLPFLLSGSIDNFGDAFFESMSGFTTTGATILTDIGSLPHGILFWRSLTQWIGGIVIIFISLSVFPVVRSINIHLTATDFSGQPTDKIRPRIVDAVKRLITIYFFITLSEVILLIVGGMPVFDAVCHSFSTLSTGGFSTRNNGIAAFSSPYIKIVLTIFMFIAGTNMTLIYFGLKRNFRKIVGNNEFVYYSLICLFFLIIGALILYYAKGFQPAEAFLDSAFQVVSIVTTTGFYLQDYNLWGNLMIFILLVLMFTGGTAGSTSGGIKIARLLLITKNNRLEIKRLIHPNAIMPVRSDKHSIPQSTIHNLLVFIILYSMIVCFGSLIISLMGYDIITSFSTSASMLGNIGPGIGTFGPFTNYSSVPMGGKYFLSGLMLLGRLELFSVMVLFTSDFYKS
ncbi:MAG: TrkH family potassium uptake protein [Bacteroidales bacterium]|nr:TrkH family potassium uptake protein [Bacteroidales bacterium]